MTIVRHLYWDTCVFIAHLQNEHATYGKAVDDIAQFLLEAGQNECQIYTSTITIAEIPRRRMRSSGYGTFVDFLNDFAGAVIQITADPPIMAMAAELHGHQYSKTGGKRTLGTPDAIHLASAIALQETYGVKLESFHTFDNGGQRGIGGKSTPLLDFHDWCEGISQDALVQKVIALPRSKPLHPEPRMLP